MFFYRDNSLVSIKADKGKITLRTSSCWVNDNVYGLLPLKSYWNGLHHSFNISCPKALLKCVKRQTLYKKICHISLFVGENKNKGLTANSDCMRSGLSAITALSLSCLALLCH